MVQHRRLHATDATSVTKATLQQTLHLLQVPQTLQKGYRFWIQSKKQCVSVRQVRSVCDVRFVRAVREACNMQTVSNNEIHSLER